MDKKIPEIVAPGGSHNKAMVASLNGAEAVYVGVPFTSLRMRQNKMRTFDDLKKTISDLHANGTKAYLTMNIFPRNIDIKVFEHVVEQIKDVGADAIIFSDPGTFNIIRKHLPDMPLHLSTQSSILNKEAVKFWYDLGVKRIVLARELNIKEIKEIKEYVPGIEIEVFVHGAMCVAYSGRCLLGEYFSGRDGNKGECSHVCRYKFKVLLEEEKRPGKHYELTQDDEGSYLLSSKDLCTIERLGELLPYVDGLKIEGRSKSEWYVGSCVKSYKHVRDAILNGTPIDEEIKNLVYQIPHRYYWDGFLFNDLKTMPDGEDESGVSAINETTQTKSSNALSSFISNIKSKFVKSEKPKIDNSSSVTEDTAGPISQKQYIGLIEPEFIEIDMKKYYMITVKDNVFPGDHFEYMAPNGLGTLYVKEILDKNKNPVERAHCNMGPTYIHFDTDPSGWECLYR